MYNSFILYLRDRLDNDVSVRTYLRDLITVFHYLMREGVLEPFTMKSIKVDQSHIETYSDAELRCLLKKPDRRKCSFLEYQSWVITNFLFSTGMRQRSLIHVQIKYIDLDNAIVTVRVTKNRKVLIIPINQTMVQILKEFLKYRKHKSMDDWLFCNVFGDKLVKSTC